MLTSLYARVSAYLEMIAAVLVGHLRGRRVAGASVGFRAVTFIEYALLAAIAVVIAALFRTQLKALFVNLFSRLNGSVNTN